MNVEGYEKALRPPDAVDFVPPESSSVWSHELSPKEVRKGTRRYPVMCLEYWNNPDATREKYVNDWWLTGDLGKKDEDGYFWFVGRKDDLITSSGYRIGPAEIEDCLMKHPTVGMVAVVGSPDKVRTEVVKAFIIPKSDGCGSFATTLINSL